MTTKPPTQPPLTLFDAAQFEFEADHTVKAPSRLPLAGLHGVAVAGAGAGIGGARKPVPDADAARARRRRARARLAKRRYLADTEGYARMEQTRRALQVVEG